MSSQSVTVCAVLSAMQIQNNFLPPEIISAADNQVAMKVREKKTYCSLCSNNRFVSELPKL